MKERLTDPLWLFVMAGTAVFVTACLCLIVTLIVATARGIA